MAKIDPLLLNMQTVNASDLHMVVGQKPKYRIDGEVRVIEDHDVLSEQTLGEYLFEICHQQQRERYEQNLDFDLDRKSVV